MPLYEYQCRECGKTLEITQKFSDAPLKDCPECGKPALEKCISHTSFQLKGSGWYASDYKKSGASTSSTPVAKQTAAPAPAASAPGCGAPACGATKGGCDT